jgi:uncharacterized protein YggE
MSRRKHVEQALLLAGLALLGVSLPPLHASADEADDARVIVAHGSGEVRVTPDSFQVDVGAEARAATLDQARTEVNARMRRVTDAVRALGMSDLTLQTSVLQLQPIYAPIKNGDDTPSIIGYTATNRLSVVVEHASPDALGDHAASVLDAAVTAGANTLGNVRFYLADTSSARDQALAAAVKAAAHDAQTMATAAGVTLGPLSSIEESSGSTFVPHPLALQIASTPIEVGDVTVTSDVTARFAIE